jgi:hypothetical protein
MTTRELIIQELEQTPDFILEEVLDFLRYLKVKQRSPKPIRVITKAGETMVSLPLEAIANSDLSNFDRSPTSDVVSQIQHDLQRALTEAGYHSREDIVELVRQVKREMADEHDSICG